MTALELADFYESQSSQVAAMLRKQAEAIKTLRDALEELRENFSEASVRNAQAALEVTEELK